MMSPNRSNSQALGDIGQTSTKLIFEKYGWTADIIKSDYGEDIDACVFLNNIRTKYHFRCQVKSTGTDSKYIKKLRSGEYSVTLKTSLLKLWITCSFPVFLVVYDEKYDCLYWCNPVKQILKKTYNLNNNTINLHVSNDNKIDVGSRIDLLLEIESFYKILLRLDEANIECNVIPVLMPEYKIIPSYEYFNFLHTHKKNLDVSVIGLYLEVLPSWMSVLKKIDPSPIIGALQISFSHSLDLEAFLNSLKQILANFDYKVKKGEWVSFITSPVKTTSRYNSDWQSELTYWNSYSYINKKLITDYEYSYELPSVFLIPHPVRAGSWSLMYARPDLDLAVQLYGNLEVTPAIKNVEAIKKDYVKNQYILWTCKNSDINHILEMVTPYEYTVKILKQDKDTSIIAITTWAFDPFIGMFSSGISWDHHERLNVRKNIISSNNFKHLPGQIYTGEVPSHFRKVIEALTGKEYKDILVINEESIPGFPIKHNNRLICVSRYQMIKSAIGIKKKLDDEFKKTKAKKIFKALQFEFRLVDDMWVSPIYCFSITWTPNLTESSYMSYKRLENDIVCLFNHILPTNNDGTEQLENTYRILEFAGQINFEK
jgi:hypothetical protein